MKNNQIVVIGSMNMDLVATTPRIVQRGETIMGHSVKYVTGGKGGNQAYCCAKLGANVTMLGKVGNDDHGRKLLQTLAHAGVATDFVGVEQDTASGLALIQVSDEGENSIIVLPGANAYCDTQYVRANEEQIHSSKIVILQMEIDEQAVYEGILLGKKHQKTVILNPSPVPMSASIPDHIYANIDYLIPNETELMQLTGLPVSTTEEVEAAAKQLIAKGVKHIIVTLGSKGSIYVTDQTATQIAAEKVQAVDTTSAGDSFLGGFAVALSEGKNDIEAIQFATKVSSIVVTKEGAQTSIPTRDEVDSIIQ